MKILHIINSLDCGGLEKFVIDLSAEQNARGHKAQIACLQKGGDLKPLAKDHKLLVTTFDKKGGIDFKLISQLSTLIQKEKFDIVHTHNIAPLIYGTIASKLAFNHHIIQTRHGREPVRANSLIWALNKKVVTISNDAKEFLLQNNSVNENKISVIHNGINLKAFNAPLTDEQKNNFKKELGLKEDTLILGNVGRLAREKDQGSLIKAFKKLISKKIKVELVIVGDGPLKNNLMQLAKEFDVFDQIKFLGYRSDISKLLQIFDIFILSSFTEGISLTLLEAMASGKPVIATKVGGNPEVVVDNVTGILVPCGFPERIESAVMKLYANRSLLPEYGQAGQKRAYELFSLDRMTSEYEKLYQEINKN